MMKPVLIALAVLAAPGLALAAGPLAGAAPQAPEALAAPAAARCDPDARRGTAARRACRDVRREPRRATRGYCPEDDDTGGGPYGPTITSEYEFQGAQYDFQAGCRANLKERP